MIALLANPPAPLALRLDLIGFRRPKRTQTFSELIWKVHQIIVNPASHADEIKVAKRDMLRVIGKAKQSPKTPAVGGCSPFSSRINKETAMRVVQGNNPRAAQFPNYRKVA